MGQTTWAKLPAFCVLSGGAGFMKELLVRRFSAELFGDAEPEILRYDGPANDQQLGSLPLAQVLDELRTPSFFSPSRIVRIDNAATFLAAHAEILLPFVDQGFAGGHLILSLDKLDGRRKISKEIASKGWVVECAQPFDRPPPWDQRTPAWESDLSRWVVERARLQELDVDLETAFAVHDRAGTDLAIIEEQLDKLKTYLTSHKSRRIDHAAVQAVVGDTRENSVFALVDLFLEGRRQEALREARLLFERGFASDRGPRTMDPAGIVMIFIGTAIPRLRSLRRAHAMRREGAGPDDWVRAGLVMRPFLSRFERQLRVYGTNSIGRAFERLFRVDRGLKTGGDARRLFEILLASPA